MFGPCLVMQYKVQYIVPVLSPRKGGLVVSVRCFFLMVPVIGLQCLIVAFPGHMHLLLMKSAFIKRMLRYIVLITNVPS